MIKTLPRLIFCSTIVSLCAMAAEAQIQFSGIYEQDFDSLPLYESGTGTSVFTFNNNSTLRGWYSSTGTGQNQGRSSGGAAAATGTLYNWGRTANRALGTFASAGYDGQTEYFGVQLQNTGDATIQAVNLQYVVEQWRRNINATTWNLEYLVTSASGDQLGADGYAVIAGSTISSGTGPAGGINGDYSGNRTAFDLGLDNIQWESGAYLWLRWTNAQGVDSGGLALDDLRIVAIPESSAVVLVLLLPTALALRLRSRR